MGTDSPIVRRLMAAVAMAKAAAQAERVGRFRIELRKIVAALDRLIGYTGPNARPGLADAVADEEDGIDDVVSLTWIYAHKVDMAMENPLAPFPFRIFMNGDMGHRYMVAAKQLRATMRVLRERWGYPSEFWDQRIPFDFGKYRTDHTISPPIVDPAEHKLLLWYRCEFATVMRWLESIEIPRPATPPKPLDRSKIASLKLVGPDELPIIRGVPWDFPLNPKQYHVLKVLVDSFPRRVSLATLKNGKGGVGGAAGILTRLKKKPPWDSVIDMAVEEGKSGRGNGYAIKPWS